MKRLTVLALAALMLLAAASPARALEVEVRGDFHFAYFWQNNAYTFFDEKAADTFMARQRTRLTVEFIASEELKGVIQFHSSSMWWGDEDSGAALDATSQSFYVRQAYIDWQWPASALRVKMGLQSLTLPGAVAGSPVLNDSAAGVNLSYAFNDTLSASLGWYRLGNKANAAHGSVDTFVLLLPVSGEAFSLTPWGEITAIGSDASLGDNKAANRFLSGDEFEERAYMWHAGLAAELSLTERLSLKADAIYGALNSRGEDPETGGWFLDLKLACEMELGSLALAAWYSSGNDEDYAYDRDARSSLRGLEGGTMPSLVNSNDGNAGWGMSSLGFWGNTPLLGGGFVSQSGIGTWGVGLMLENFSLLNDLSHTARVLYYRGTSHREASREVWLAGSNLGTFMNEKDSAVELNLDSKYRIYRNLSMTLDLAVVFMDWESGARSEHNVDDHMWRCGVGFQYNF